MANYSGSGSKQGNRPSSTVNIEHFSDLTIIGTQRTTIKVEHYIFHSSLCYIQAGKKSLKFQALLLEIQLIWGKRYSLKTLEFLCLQYFPALITFEELFKKS